MKTADRAAYLGFDLIHHSNHPDYPNRKMGVYFLIDRRSKKLCATYSTLQQIEKCLDRIEKS